MMNHTQHPSTTRCWVAGLVAVLVLAVVAPVALGQTTPSPLCEAQNLCTCWTNTTASGLPACYNLSLYYCSGGNKLVAGREPSGQCSIPRAGTQSPSPSPRPSPSPSPKPPSPSPSPSPKPPSPSPSPAPVVTLPPPSPVCEAQNLCTCWTNTTASGSPACYSVSLYTCPGGNKLVSGAEPTGQCSIPRATTQSPSPSPRPPSPSPSPKPSSPAPSPSPKPPVPSPSPAPVVTLPPPSPVCEAQNLCTCWTNTTASGLPACYSVSLYTCPGGNKLVSGAEPTGQCSIPRATTQSPSPSPPSPSPRPPSPSPSPRPPSPSPSPSPKPPSPSPKPPSPSPSPSPVVQLPPSPLCEAQNLCTCWNNATTTQPPACYSLTIYRCPTGTQLLSGAEPSGQCSIPRAATQSPSPRPPSPSPSPSPPVVPSPSPPPIVPSPSPIVPPSPSPSPSPPPPPPPPPVDICDATNLGTLVAPVAGTLTGGAPAVSTLPPFARLDNTKTTRLIRMPPGPEQDPNGLLSRPVPTSAWWTNIMWGGTASNQMYGQDPVQIFPYHVRVMGPPSTTTAATDRGLWFCKPFYTGDQEGGVIFATWPELQLTLQEIQNAGAPSITARNWDDLSLNLEYNSGASGSQTTPHLVMPLLKGSPYISAQVPVPATPIVRGPRAGNGGGTINSVTQVSPTKLKIVVGSVPGGEGTHTFFLWGSGTISYTLAAGNIQISGGEAGGKFSGWLRMAWAPNAGAAGATAIEAMLDQYVDAVPVGGEVNAFHNATAGTASYSLTWALQSMSGAASPTSKLLILALPHHVDTLASPAAPDTTAFPLGVAAAGTSAAGFNSNGAYTSQPPQGSGRSAYTFGSLIMTVRGPQVPVVGSCWVLQEQAVPLVSETEAAANLNNPAWRTEIEQTLLADLPLVLPPSSLPANNLFADWLSGARSWPWKGLMNLDAYFGGSEMQAMARLIFVAQALADTSAAAGSSFGPVAASAAANVTNALGLLLQRKLTLPCTADGTNPGSLCYDSVFKLITTNRALRSADEGVEFFSRTGTDHHFHYGYWVGAAAAVASQNPAWYKTYLEPAVNALIRDYANNDKTDPLLPFARHKDWYMGHSWAAGLQLSYDGKNQESSSEAVNAYTAIALLGKATGNAELEGWGQLLLANEVTAARKYTQAYAGNDIYLQIARESANNGITRAKVATILFAAKASSFNWFDSDMLTRHGIQWMPFSPEGSNALLPAGWLQETVPLCQATTKIATNRFWSWSDQGGGSALGWRVLLSMAQAMVPGQQAAAWSALKSLPIDASDGFALCGTIGRLSRTAAKWWIATRPSA